MDKLFEVATFGGKKLILIEARTRHEALAEITAEAEARLDQIEALAFDSLRCKAPDGFGLLAERVYWTMREKAKALAWDGGPAYDRAVTMLKVAPSSVTALKGTARLLAGIDID